MSESIISEVEQSDFNEEDDDHWNLGKYIGGRDKAGKRHGRGWAILPNGDQYDGLYRHGVRHGMGLYVFKGGARYYGIYRCGHRSGRGMFIYPDGSIYEGQWRNNVKHGKGRYMYPNGHSYSGGWYRGLRHGIGTYTMASEEYFCVLRYTGTWQYGERIGPFELSFGDSECATILHGYWDVHYPRGPAVFNFGQCYMLSGFFNEADRYDKFPVPQLSNFNEDSVDGEDIGGEGDSDIIDKTLPTVWYSQDISLYDYAYLPQEPVPIPLSDSEISVCSMSETTPQVSSHDTVYQVCEEEGEGEVHPDEECEQCECSMSECATLSITDSCDSPCAIDVVDKNPC